MYKVLCIVDEQIDFTSGVLGNAECRATVPVICDLVRSKEFDKVVLTKDTHDDDYLNTQEGRKLPVIHTKKETEGWEIVPEIMDAVKECYGDNREVVCKGTFGSMYLMMNVIKPLYDIYGSDLEITFVGVCTGICVLSNAVPAKMFAPEAVIRVIENACACVTPETHHIAIEAMKTCQIDII